MNGGFVLLLGLAMAPDSWSFFLAKSTIDTDESLFLNICQVPIHQTVLIEVLHSSDGSFLAAPTKTVTVLHKRSSHPADNSGNISQELRLDWEKVAPKQGALWLRVTPSGGALPKYQKFGIEVDPCGFFATLTDLFLQGRCDPKLSSLFDPLRDGQAWQFSHYQLVVQDWDKPNTPWLVPNSQGATGLWWLDDHRLLFTRWSGDFSGLYLTDLRRRESRKLVSAKVPFAPFQVGRDNYGWVEQGRAQKFLVWEKGTRRLPLGQGIDQMLSVTAKQQMLGVRWNRQSGEPLMVCISLKQRKVFELGGISDLYLNSMRRPVRSQQVLAMLIKNGKPQVFVHRQDHQFVEPLADDDSADSSAFPAWSPSGSQVAYLLNLPK